MGRHGLRPRAGPTGLIRNELVIRIVAIIALVWGAAYLGWRAVDTWDRTEPALFLLLYACELFGCAMLASFCFLAWRIPTPKRPPIDASAQRGRPGLHLRRGIGCPRGNAPGLCRDHLPACDLGARRRPQGVCSGPGGADGRLLSHPRQTTVTPRRGTSTMPLKW